MSSSAFINPTGRPSLSISVSEPRGVGFLGSGASGSLVGVAADLGAPRVTTALVLEPNLFALSLDVYLSCRFQRNLLKA